MTQIPSNFTNQDPTHHSSSSQNSQSVEPSVTVSSSSQTSSTQPTTWTTQTGKAKQPGQSARTLNLASPPLKGMGIRAKTTLLAITVGTVPVLLVGGLATYLANQTITQETLKDKQAIALEISNQAEAFVRGRLEDVQAIASSPIMTDATVREASPTQNIINYIDGYVERDPAYSIIAAAAPDGAFGFIGENRTPLRNSSAQYPPEVDAPGAKPLVERNLPYFLEARKTLKPAVTPLRLSTTEGRSSFYMAAPALDSAGKLAYVIFTRTYADEISRLINERVARFFLGTGEDAQTYDFRIIDHGQAYYEGSGENAEEIPSSRIEIDGNSIKIDGEEFQPGGDIFIRQNRIFVSDDNGELDVDIESIFPEYKQLRDSKQISTARAVSKIDGKEYLLAYVPLPPVEGLSVDWGVLVTQPTSVAFAPQRQLLLTLLLGTIATTALVSAIAVLVANRATRPLLAATGAVEKIGQGELTTRVEVAGDDELAVLGANINRMAEQIKNLLEEKLASTEQARLNFLTGVTGSDIRSTQDLENALSAALQVAREVLTADRVVIYRFNSDWSGAVAAESVVQGLPSCLNRNIEDACIPENLLEAYRQGRVVPTRDVFDAGFHPKHLRLMAELSVRANLVVPIVVGEQLFGLLIAHQCSGPRDWQESEVAFLRQLAAQLGLAIDRVVFLEQLEQVAEEQRRLKESLQNRALELLMEVDPISKGDLTVRAKVTADEIGTIADSYNATVDSLRKIVAQVKTVTERVVETATVSEASVQDLSEEALRQSEEIAAALQQVEEMATAVQAVATNAEQAELVAQQAARTVLEGDLAMNRTVDGIQAIRATVAETAKKVKYLGESSQKISTVVELISAFAAQTNMLALNASIEASRAGEEGRGFAVVAAEVRSLAQQSAKAADEIRMLVSSIQSETNEVVSAIEVGTEQVVMGTKLVDETRQSLNKITAASAEITTLVEAIAQTTVVQSKASETVTQKMKDVAEIAQKTSNEASQVSASFEQLREVATTLQEGVGQFKVN